MRTFAQKLKATQSTTSTIPSRSGFGQNREVKSILQLHSTSGNHAVQRPLQDNAQEFEIGSTTTAPTRFAHNFSRIPLFAKARPEIQPKLRVSTPGDKHEQEADRIAEQVVRMHVPEIQRACACGGECPKCLADQSKHVNERLQTSRLKPGDWGQTEVPPIIHKVLRSPAQPLNKATRAFMESRFGHDFSRVRVHADEQAARSAGAINALAYTVGKDIVFGAGEYAPQTNGGRKLLAHELTHVVQQGANGFSRTGVLQRYSHEDCEEADLRTHIWPADGIAKRKVVAAIAAVTASPVSARTQGLFAKYFGTRTPDVNAIAEVFQEVKDAFDGDSYTYECENDCKAEENAYSGWAWDIHLCMNNIRGRDNDCIARTIIHEFTHKYSGTDHDGGHCYNACDTAGCPGIDPDDALDNAYAFAGFAHEV